MADKTQSTMRGDFDFKVPSVIPSFVQGNDAEAVYKEVSRVIKDVWFDSETRTMQGSSTFLAARVDSIVRGLNKGIRVATLQDLSCPEVMGLVRYRHYSDTPAVVLRTSEDEDYEQNDLLIKQLVPLVEAKLGRLELPVLITGFDVAPSKSEEGRLDIVARDDFSALHDERLGDRYSARTFSALDENGLPNFNLNGERGWSARQSGLSGVFLNEYCNLNSKYGGDNLAGADRKGRIILVMDAVLCD